MANQEMSGMDENLKVAVVGGGMCGLAVAVGLTKAGVDVRIYEAAPKFGEVGAGVGLGPNAMRVLRELDLLEHVLASVHPEVPTPRPFCFLSGLGEHEKFYDYPTTSDDAGLGIHRAIFLDALVHLVDHAKTYFNKRCTGLRAGASQRIQLAFADGTSAEADVIIGADGIRSVVRTFVVDGPTNKDSPVEEAGGDSALQVVRAAFTNTLAYRGLVPVAKLKSIGMLLDLSMRPHCFTGPGKHIITFPINSGTVINVVAFACDRSVGWGELPLPPGTPWVTPRTTEELLETYAGWGREVQLLLGCLERPSVWAVHAVDPLLESYSRGGVVLIGDAAHGMLPHLGAGAGQGLEDVLLLVRLLANPQTRVENVESVLSAYDALRRPRANMVLMESTKCGDIYEGFGPSGPSIEGMRADLEGMWDKVWHHDILADIDAALARLVEVGVFVD